jgi:hypothetical protein
MTTICNNCGLQRDGEKLPRGWKRINNAAYCGACMKTAWIIKSVALRVAEIIDMQEGDTFFSPFSKAWRLSTDLANWAQLELLKREQPRLPSMTKMPKAEPFNLYGHFTKHYPERSAWDGAAGSASAILQAVYQGWVGKSNRNRFSVIWKGDASAAYFRWPYPFVVRSAETKIGWTDHEGGRWPWVSVTLPGRRLMLRLAQGTDWIRSLRDFDKLCDGSALLGDTKICAKFAGGKLKGVMVRIAGRFPRTVSANAGKVATVSTQPNALLRCDIEGSQREWWLHMPHLRGLIERYEVRRAELADDTKFEKRWPAKKRAKIIGSGKPRMERMDDNIKTVIQQAAAQTVGYAVRNGCGSIVYDDSCRDFLPTFRWFALAERFKQVAHANGLGFTVLKGGESTQTDAA